jgi:hypothetical protein
LAGLGGMLHMETSAEMSPSSGSINCNHNVKMNADHMPDHTPSLGSHMVLHTVWSNPVVADFLSQARPAGRFVSSDSGGVDRPLTNPAERRYVCGPS